MLKIVVSESQIFAGVDFTKYQDYIDKAIHEKHIPVIAKYLHGQVERSMGYDIGLILNGEECNNFEKEEYIPGIYDVEIVDYDKPCKAFLWKTEGRIVATDDSESMKYAEIKYRNNI